MKNIKLIFISIVIILFSGCGQSEDYNYIETGTYDSPFYINYYNASKTYQTNFDSNYFIIQDLPINCLITFKTIYNGQYSYYLN